MESKKRRLMEEMDGASGSAVQQYLAPFSAAEVSDILTAICTSIPAAFDILRERADASISHRKVFVRGLAWSSTGPDLQAIMSKHGGIIETAVVLDKNTGMSKGFAFVTFETAAGAMSAVEEGTYQLDGRTIHATIAAMKGDAPEPHATTGGHTRPSHSAGPAQAPMASAPDGSDSARKVFLRGLPYSATEDAVRRVFGAYGPIDRIEMLTEKDSGKFKGSAFITFRSSTISENVLRVSEFQVDGRTVRAHTATERGGGVNAPSPYGYAVPAQPLPQQYPMPNQQYPAQAYPGMPMQYTPMPGTMPGYGPPASAVPAAGYYVAPGPGAGYTPGAAPGAYATRPAYGPGPVGAPTTYNNQGSGSANSNRGAGYR